MFRGNNPIMRWLSWVMDQLTLNMMYMVCCLPVVTIGAATSALYTVQYALAESRGSGVPMLFWQGMRQNFRQATGLFAIVFLMGLVLGGALFAAVIQGLLGSPIVMIFAAVILTAYLGTVSWLFPLQARFEQKTSGQLFNAYAVSVSRLPLTILMIVINFWWIPTFLVLSYINFGIYLFFITFCQAALSSFLCGRILLRFVKT